MCTTQLLVIADFTRRHCHDRRSNNNVRPVARRICRKLFTTEPGDSESTSQVLRRLQEELQEEWKKKWNFDFQTETPLPGRYQWVPVRPRRIPSASSTASASSLPQTAADEETAEVVAEVSPAVRTEPETSNGPHGETSRLKQGKITDYMQQRKRHRSDGSGVSAKRKIPKIIHDSLPASNSYSSSNSTMTGAPTPPPT